MKFTTMKILFINESLAIAAFCLAMPNAAAAHGPLHEQILAITQVIAQFSDSAQLYLKRGELHRHHQDWQAAFSDFDRAERLAPSLAVVDLHRGKAWLDAGAPAKAKAALNKFLSKAPNDADGLITRARALAQLGEHLASAEDFTRAIARVDVPVPEFYLERAQAWYAAQCVDEALRGLDEGMASLGQIVTLQLYAIELEIEQKSYDAALARLETVAAQSPRKEKWLARRGEILQLAGRHEEARLAFASALREMESLPAGRRHTKATAALERRLRAML